MKFQIALIHLLFACSVVTVSAQSVTKSTQRNTQYWLRYFNQITFNKKLSAQTEIEDRRFFENNAPNFFLIYNRLHYKIHAAVDFAPGLALVWISPNDPNALNKLTIPEIRPIQEFNINQSLTDRISIQHRLRMDERFIRKNNGKELLSGYTFNWRFRYRFQITAKLNKIQAPLPLLLKGSNELMVNFGESILYNHFDQNRASISFEKSISKLSAIELGYIYWYQQRNTGHQFFKRDIVRLTFYNRFKINPKVL